MACFTVPAAEAIITTVAEKIIKSKEKNQTVKKSQEADSVKIPFSTKLSWLNKMLWGGSALLVTAVWGIMVGVVSIFEKRGKTTGSAKLAGGLA